MKPALRCSLLLAAGLALSAKQALAQAERQVDYLAIICSEEAPARHEDWNRNGLLALGRALGPSMKEKTIGVKREPCAQRMPDAACFGGPRVLICRNDTLKRVLHASAWLTARYALAGGPDYETFRRSAPRAVAQAFRFAEGGLEDSEANTIIEAIGRHERIPDGAPGSVQANKPIGPLTALYQRIVDYNMAALIGHEVSHVFGETCPLQAPSRAEQSGIFSRVQKLQLSGELFCKAFPVVEEIKADLCALRHIRRLADASPEDGAKQNAAEDFARRISADLIALQTIGGWRRYPGIPVGKFVMRPLDQYFYSSLRLVLMAAEARGAGPGPKLCGEAASLFVHGVQENFKACPTGKGIVPDEVLALLSPGVEKSWNGAPWTPDSVSCQP